MKDLPNDIESLKALIYQLLEKIAQLEIENTELHRLREHEAGVFAFALEPAIQFTNNQAERDLCPAKVKQKVSGCFRTKAGASVYDRLQAVVSTCRKQGLNVFTILCGLFLNTPVELA